MRGNMSDATRLILPFIAGTALGTFYFTGLWFTVRNLPDSERPLALVFWSFMVRASVAVAGFYMVMNGRWEQLAAALLGFLFMREILIRRLGRKAS
jgi:F1F0 ATPase subunit 2